MFSNYDVESISDDRPESTKMFPKQTAIEKLITRNMYVLLYAVGSSHNVSIVN